MLSFIDTPFQHVADSVGATSEELKLIASFFLAYPLAGVLKRVPDTRPIYKNLFILSVSLFFLVGLFDFWLGSLTLLISCGGTYAIAYYLRQSPYMPWLGFLFAMGHLSISHLSHMAAPAGTQDITFAQMVMVMKLTSFCWNVADGVLPDEQLNDFQKDRRLKEVPSLMDYAGYIFFFPALFAGPVCDYAEYRHLLDCSMVEVAASTDTAKKPLTRRKRKIPRSSTLAMLKMAKGLAWIGAFVAFSTWFYPSFLLGDAFPELSFPCKLLYVYLVSAVARFKYYGSWALTEGACIQAGRVDWIRLRNVDPWGVESAQNCRDYLAFWNINTNKWLRNYVFLRLTPRGQKPGFRATLATFVTSAFWHGFHPGYYLSFVFAGFIQTAAKNCRRYLRPFFLDPRTQAPLPTKRYYDLASWATTQLVFAFTVMPFLVLNFSDSTRIWARVYFYAPVLVFMAMAGFAAFHKTLSKMLEQRAARAGIVPIAPGAAPGKPTTHCTASTESFAGALPVLGLPANPEKELEEAITEMRELGDQMGSKSAEIIADFEARRAEFGASRAGFKR